MIFIFTKQNGWIYLLFTAHTKPKKRVKRMLATDELETYRISCGQMNYTLQWLSTLADDKQIKERLLPYLMAVQPATLAQLQSTTPIPGILFVTNIDAQKYLLQGHVSVIMENIVGPETPAAVIPVQKQQYRSIEEPKEEFAELGPFEAFTESLETNLYMMRRRLPIEEVCVHKIEYDNGRIKGAIVYHKDHKQEALQLEQEAQTAFENYSDSILDTSTLALAQNGLQFTLSNVNLLTEHPVQCVRRIMKGQVVLLLEGSRKGLIAPTYLSDYFQAPSDYLMALPFVMLIRAIRIFSFIMALTLLPLYVAIINFHYQMIPSKVIETLFISRYAVPFSAFFEALIMEAALLVLLEAVARLPTKLSQSAGVVAGIVLGTAAVEAKLVSNIMIVVMGASALFTLTSASIALRNSLFVYSIPALLLANFMGITGIFLFWFLLMARLLQVKSLDRPFTTFSVPALTDFFRRRF